MKYFRKIPLALQLVFMFVVLLIVMFVAISFGAANTTLADVWYAIWHSSDDEKTNLLREIRFPRVLAAVAVGAALAVAGAIMQGVTRNPLADPGLLGLTSGANAALAIGFVLVPNLDYSGAMLACFIGAAIGMAIVYSIGSSSKTGMSPLKLVLAGAAVSMFLQAVADGTGLLFQISKDVSMWTSGGLQGISWSAFVVMPIIIVALISSIIISRQLTILSLNEDVAVGLGQKTFVIKTMMFIIVVLLAGAAVSIVGNLAFIGLMIPHIVRGLVGADYRAIIPMSMIVGGLFMVVVDLIGRTMNAPFETPIVAIVSVLGLPFFLVLVKRGGRFFA
ncbi:FecCD family ABC transporter permease [Kurthia sibirica]|uniref:Iron ABC transporter n=1 Tax=Kurthia sibirica TaxID=202750 RepID=A0A2U3AR18_9BACL|nr:iron ABC transporter permease [Kurthia sibirica]PWI26983.1 iron ABC transporter [Kurthia sibirica]GEK35616.1 ferrichrome ABC transporter permease [Kurthia sibirica]